MLADNYPINEVFETIQGEGCFTGKPSIFVRLQGCPVGCSWCDTKHTWYQSAENQSDFSEVVAKNGDSDSWANVTPQALLEYCSANYSAKHLVITGGEPCLFDLNSLCGVFEQEGYTTQIETSGTHTVLTTNSAWVTVSPKIGMKGGMEVLPSSIARANEIKHPVGTQKDIERLKELLNSCSIQPKVEICLQPISQKPRATELAIQTCIRENWRLSIQTHKYLGIE